MGELHFDSNSFYRRQIVLPELGTEGQNKLRKAKAAIVGLGGLGTVSATYLARSGVGHLRLIDQDRIEIHNLHRQILYEFGDLHCLKAEKAAEKLSHSNPEIQVESINERLMESNVDNRIKDVDIVLDGLDNMASRYILNRACHRHGIPYIFGGVTALEGNVSILHPPNTPCLECMMPSQEYSSPKSCVSGILGATAGIVGAIQAMEAIKALADVKTDLRGKLLVCDFRTMEFEKIDIFRNEECDVCGIKSL
ncbi:MAG: HesA/MoeB/ThiF family protein [archaeon]